MLTPAKIKNHHFEASGRNAYKADGVDRFFEEVADSYEQMFRENGEMYKKISLLAERLEEYRNDEDNIRNALLTAQRMAEQIQREAREKSDALISEAQARAVAENARVDAQTTEMLTAATYQAQSIIAEANKQAAKIIDDATRESKEAAISARDWMIKEEATLEMMKIEVTKFKKQILDSYAQQLELIETLPEIVYAQIDAEKEAEEEIAVVEEEPAVETPEEVTEAPVEESVAEETVPVEEIAAVSAFETYEEELEEIPAEEENAGVDVETLQQMITETEDTDLEDEHLAYEEESEVLEELSDEELVIPEVDDGASADLDEIVGYFSDKNSGDVMFTKPETKEKSGGFSLDVDKISSYDTTADTEFEADEFDEEFDDDNNGGDNLASKFKSFFKK